MTIEGTDIEGRRKSKGLLNFLLGRESMMRESGEVRMVHTRVFLSRISNGGCPRSGNMLYGERLVGG